MAVVPVASTVYASPGTTDTAVTNSVPGGVVDTGAARDLLLWEFSGSSTSTLATPATPAGWSVWTPLASNGTGSKVITFWRFASSEPASYTAPVGAGRWTGVMTAWRGADQTTPQDVASVTNGGGTSMPAITTATDGAVVVFSGKAHTASGVVNSVWSTTSGAIAGQVTQTQAGTTNDTQGVGYQTKTPAGAVTPVLTISSFSNTVQIRTVSAIRPAAAGTPATFTTTVGDVAADGGTGTFAGAGTIASTVGDAPADGGVTTMTGAAVFASTAGDAPADGGLGAFTGAALFAGTTGDAPADGGTGALVGSAAAVFTTTVGDAAADGGTGSLIGAAAFLTAVGDAVGDAAPGVFTGAAIFVTDPGDAAAAGGVGSLAAGTVFATTVGDAVADGGPGGFTGAALFVAQAGDVSADGGAAVFTAAAVFLTLPGDVAADGGPASFVVIIATATPSTRRERVPGDPRTDVVPGERRRRTAGTESRTLSA